MRQWLTMGIYQLEYVGWHETGWIRSANGRRPDGSWPEWHTNTGRYR